MILSVTHSKGYGRKLSWFNFMYYSGFCFRIYGNRPKKKLGKDDRYPSWDLIHVPQEYKLGWSLLDSWTEIPSNKNWMLCCCSSEQTFSPVFKEVQSEACILSVNAWKFCYLSKEQVSQWMVLQSPSISSHTDTKRIMILQWLLRWLALD
jgi:hypothetical protein